MSERRTLALSDAEHYALKRMARSHAKVYRRRRAQALLLIAEGHTPSWVAHHGLDKPVAPDQVYTWLNRYQQEGIEGLAIRPGRGRKPAHFPAQPASSH